MHIVIISGSSRPQSQSLKVSNHVAGAIKALDSSYSTDIIDLTGNPLPLWEENPEKRYTPVQTVWAGYSDRLKKADALVVVSPEWHGMVPAGLKNFFLHWSAAEVGHKPALIVAVSASRGGAYPVNEIRTSGYKNSRVLYLPEHILCQDVTNILNGPTESSDADGYIRKRITYALRMLASYADALAPVRASGVTSTKDYANGM